MELVFARADFLTNALLDDGRSFAVNVKIFVIRILYTLIKYRWLF